eukprot:scaffold510_cov242-Pinguiococcus_pyrenoidosus.AAC.17
MSSDFLERFQNRIVKVADDGSVRRLQPRPDFSAEDAESPHAQARQPPADFKPLATDLRNEAVNSSYFKLTDDEKFAKVSSEADDPKAESVSWDGLLRSMQNTTVGVFEWRQMKTRKVSVSDLKKAMSGLDLSQPARQSERKEAPREEQRVIEKGNDSGILLEIWTHNATRAPKPLPRPLPRPADRIPRIDTRHANLKVPSPEPLKEAKPALQKPPRRRKVRSYAEMYSGRALGPVGSGQPHRDYDDSEASSDDDRHDVSNGGQRHEHLTYQDDAARPEYVEADPAFDPDEGPFPSSYMEIHASDPRLEEEYAKLSDSHSASSSSQEHIGDTSEPAKAANLLVMDAKLQQRLQRLRRRRPRGEDKEKDKEKEKGKGKGNGRRRQKGGKSTRPSEAIDEEDTRFKKNDEIVSKDPTQALYFSRHPRKVQEFRPYTLNEYRAVRPKEYVEVKPLPPDLENEELIAKRANYYRVKEFSSQLREFNKKVISSGPAVPLGTVPDQQRERKPSAREKAIEFSRKVRPPKVKRKAELGNDKLSELDGTAPRSFSPSRLEILEANYEAQRAQVDAIRRELGTTNKT